jgi:hypothetical protein
MNRFQYDVFISYNSKNRPIAEEIRKRLQEIGMRTYLDEWELSHGHAVTPQLENAIRISRAVVILIGPYGIGPWQNEEIETALRYAVQDKRPLVLMRLPGSKSTDKISEFIKNRRWLNCEKPGISEKDIDNLILAITGSKPLEKSLNQLHSEFDLPIDREQDGERIIRPIIIPNLYMDRLLNISWEMFGKGIEKLCEEITNYGHKLDVDACIGINDAGLAMANFINAAVLERRKLGYLRYEGSKSGQRVSKSSLLPRLPRNPTILLADFELKSGHGLKTAVQLLLDTYGEIVIYFAAFGALTDHDNLQIASLDELAAYPILSELRLTELFIAGIMHRPGIEPPLGLR